MEEKNVKPLTVFYHKETTTLRKISEVANRIIPDMRKDAEKFGLEQIEPINFRYIDCTEDMDKEFTLEIAMIVKEKKEYDGQFDFKEWGPLKCASHVYKGDINKIGEEYSRIFPELIKNGRKPSNEIREVYTRYLTMDSPENITEIQIGLN